jgi:hypothetical protein
MGRWARLREKKEESGPASKKRRKEMGCMGKKGNEGGTAREVYSPKWL